MNAVSNTSTDFIQENAGGSDSDTNTEETPEYYQPISAGGVDDEDLSDQDSDDDRDPNFHPLSNGYVENGISALDLSDEEQDEHEHEEEEIMREASDSAMIRAFREDESRRNAPLPAENAVRVLEAMRGISFVGSAPDWANRVPEDRWIDQVRRLRRPLPSTTIVQD
ncbi:hypothetical protein LguiA_011929 [Lonicera macranthoides]